MDRHKIESAALVLTIFGALGLLPPLAELFQLERRLLGVPAEIIYLFLCWTGLIVGAFLLSRRLPREPAAEPDRNEDNG
jgi:hypothetical protein